MVREGTDKLGARRERKMLSLDDAIKDCEEVAEKNEEESKNWAYGASQIIDDENRKKQYQKHAEMWREFASEHRQLAEWLRELKKLKSEDTVTKEACIAKINEIIAPYIPRMGGAAVAIPLELARGIQNMEPSKTQQKHSNWIPIKWHEITEEEREREGYPEEWDIIYDSRLPEDGTVTLIQTKWGIDIAPFCEDESGAYWEQYETPGEVIAWQPLPEQYEEGSGKE